MQVTYFKLNNPSDEVKENFFNDIIQFVDVDKFEEVQYVEDFGDDGNNPTGIAFTFLPADQTHMLTEAFEKHGMLIETNDITSNVLTGDFDNNAKWTTIFQKTTDTYNFEILKEFLKKNLTKDIILDKINEKGFDKLTDIDLEVLKTEE